MATTNRDRELIKLEQAVVNVMERVKNLRRMQRIPMSYILSKVPGDTIAERAENVGVTRQAYYYWIHGRSLPSEQQAERLAELTGIPIGDILYADTV